MTRRLADNRPADWIGPLYDQFAGALYRYAAMILADPSAAADAIQQVFVSLASRPRGIDCDERYLRRAVRNECFSALRRRRRELATDTGALIESASTVHGCRPDERLALEAAMKLLPAEQREVLHLKVFEGLTFQEIADETDESPNTVASRYRYAIEKMRVTLNARAG